MNLTLSHNDILAENRDTESKLFFIIYPELMKFLGSMDAAAFVQRLHFWLQNPNAGYLLKDGRKRILNGYKEWVKQFSIFSVKKIGAIVRLLERIGWVKTEKFYALKRDVGFVGATPLLQEDNQRKWYYLDYQKILEDTGLDLLFTEETDNSRVEPKRRKPLSKANIPNQDIALSQIETMQCLDLGQSSIHRKSYKTKHSQEKSESETQFLTKQEGENQSQNVKEYEEIQQNPDEGATILDGGKCSAAWGEASEKSTKIECIGSPRPPRQIPRMKYPDGPWLTEGGCLNGDFLLAQAQMWRTGDDSKSKAFGAMAIEDVEAIIACHYQKPENHAKLETHWGAYVKKAKHYLGNVRHRIEADINIPVDEQIKILAKAPAVTAQAIEPIYELALSPWDKKEILQLSQNAAAPGAEQPIAPEVNQPLVPGAEQPIAPGAEPPITPRAEQPIATGANQPIAPPPPPVDEKFGTQNISAYSNTAREEDRDFWSKLSIQGVGKSSKTQTKSFSSIANVINKVGFDDQ